ncbi:hypothetical protein QZH41_005847 [Actinostola sp. cb2023]|nr:hypothetical protein QZH41_005847 [Actinostola sp. cb2023]
MTMEALKLRRELTVSSRLQTKPQNLLRQVLGAQNSSCSQSNFPLRKKTSPAIDKNLCNIVMDLLKERLPKEKLAQIQEKYLRPENCANLVAPKVNKQVWSQLKPDTKNTDSSLQKLQSSMLSALYAILEVCNNMSKTKASNDNLTSLTHAAVLMLSANRELNVKRRDLKPSENLSLVIIFSQLQLKI